MSSFGRSGNSRWGLAARVFGFGAAAIGFVTIGGWLSGLLVLAAFGSGKVPMAPSSALLFLLFGLLIALSPSPEKSISFNRFRALAAGFGTGISLLLMVLSFFRVELDIEHFGVAIGESVQSASIGHMSPLTAASFVLAGVASIFLLRASSQSARRVGLPDLLASIVIGTGSILTLGYLMGGPLLYGSGFIPPALSTSLALLFLGISLLSYSRLLSVFREDAPGSWSSGAIAIMGLVSLSIMGVAAVGYFYSIATQRQFAERVKSELTAIKDLKVSQLVEWRRERLADAEVLFDNPALIDLVVDYLDFSAGTKPGRSLNGWLERLRERGNYERVILLDPGGAERLCIPEEASRSQSFARMDIEAILRSGQVTFLDFFELDSGRGVRLAVAVPILSNEDLASPLGCFILQIDPATFLYPVLGWWPGESNSAETLIVRRDGDDVLFLNDVKFQKDSALQLRIPLTNVDLPAARAVLGATGVLEGVDYRGVKAVAAVGAIPDSPWFLVARMDREEVFAPLRERLWWMVGIASFMISSLIAVAGLLWLKWERSRYRLIAEGEKRHGIVLQSIGDGVITADAAGRVELLNSTAELLTGWKRTEACGKPLEEVFVTVDELTREPVEGPAMEVLKTRKVVGRTGETLLISRDGTERPIADSGAPVLDEKGEVIGIVIVFRDRSEEQKAQKEIRANEARYRNLFNSIRDALLVVGIDRRIVDCNPAFVDLFGYKPDAIVGKTTEVLFSTAEEFQQMGEQIRANMQNPGFVYNIRFRRESGVEFFGEASAFFLRDSDGDALGVVELIRDVTDSRRAEEEQTKLQARLQQMQKMDSVGRLAGGVAHDFNNNLTVILGHLEMVMQSLEPSDPIRADLCEVREAATRSASLTRQLLAFARKQIVAPEVLDFNQTVEGTLKMLRRLIGEHIELVWLPGSGLAPVKIDPVQVDQLLTNLLVNARDAIDGTGRITVETANVEVDPEYCVGNEGFVPGSYVQLSVSDDGCGIESEVIDRIFEPFFTTKSGGAGTGLGLATVFGVVTQNRGFVNVYSEPGTGATFKVYLPQYEGVAHPAQTVRSAAETSGSGKTILLVEDELSILGLSKRILERYGYSVFAASTPSEALKIAKESPNRIQLLLTDVVMPEMDGHQLSILIQELHPGVKTLFMSGYTANVIVHRGVLDEGVHFIQKPFTGSALASKVREILVQ